VFPSTPEKEQRAKNQERKSRKGKRNIEYAQTQRSAQANDADASYEANPSGRTAPRASLLLMFHRRVHAA
jgi:hypothetical protein